MKENKLFDQIKSAAENAETKDFPGMEKVWQRVAEKLDKKQDKKIIGRWKKIAVAASLLLFGTLGYEFLIKNDPKEISSPDQTITLTDTVEPTNHVAVTAPLNPHIRKEASQILQKQITPETEVALESITINENKDAADLAPVVTSGYGVSAAAPKNEAVYKKAIESNKENNVELFMDKSGKISSVHKEEPLLVVDDEVQKKSLSEYDFEATDSLTILNDPLYIINGERYTEQELFGNPTSPYTPLNKQEIETFTILDHDAALKIYGEKGEKGVVIITTKNRKPLAKKAK